MSQAREERLLQELDVHDELVARYVRGELNWAEFDRAYDSFYSRYPLDGHESDDEERLLFAKHAPRISLHREIWEVLTKMTDDDHLGKASTVAGGFIGTAEAAHQIRALAATHLPGTPRPPARG